MRHKCPSFAAANGRRSEEHTSDLQSPCNIVRRLLLEKKKRGLPAVRGRGYWNGRWTDVCGSSRRVFPHTSSSSHCRSELRAASPSPIEYNSTISVHVY